MYFGGRTYSHPLIWAMNFLTQGSVFVLVTMLFSRQNRLLDREYALSRIDTLTGLYNSRAFYEQAETVLKLSRREKLPITLAYCPKPPPSMRKRRCRRSRTVWRHPRCCRRRR